MPAFTVIGNFENLFPISFFSKKASILYSQRGIILCQPDGLKSCSVCCGLFNYMDISKGNLERVLNSSHDYSAVDSYYSFNPNSNSIVRDITSHICRFQGFLANNRPGCTVHPSVTDKDGRDRSLYGAKICSEYLCPAHSILDESQKHLLIESVEDWYEYSIAIIDPEGFVWIAELAGIKSKKRPPGNGIFAKILSLSLEYHGRYLSLLEDSVFYYSQQEYNQNKHRFSLMFNIDEQREISRLISFHFPVF